MNIAMDKQVLPMIQKPGQPINFATEAELDAIAIGEREGDLIDAEIQNAAQLPNDLDCQQRHDDFMGMLTRIKPEE